MTKDQIHQEEKERCQNHHQEDHGRGLQRLAAGRPRDFAYFRADLPQKLDRGS